MAAHGSSGVDVWHFATKDGRSLRKAIDYMLPFALGHKAWPYKQIEPPNWGGLASVCRRAANAYHERAYEEAACVLYGSEYHRNAINLFEPPVFTDVTC